MTALISTEHHGKIPARVKDILTSESGCVTFRLDYIGECFAIGFDLELETEVQIQLPIEDCTLLHRPFEVGDPLKRFFSDFGQWQDYGIVVDSEGKDLKSCVHANPAFRDHSLWEGEK